MGAGGMLQAALVVLLVAGAAGFLLRRYWPGRPGCGHAKDGGGCHCGREE